MSTGNILYPENLIDSTSFNEIVSRKCPFSITFRKMTNLKRKMITLKTSLFDIMQGCEARYKNVYTNGDEIGIYLRRTLQQRLDNI
jgi:hypothetical protein